MRMSQIVAVSVLLVEIVYSAAIKSKWSPAFYSRYTFLNYEQFQPMRDRIEPANLDLPLLNAAIYYETNRIRAAHRIPEVQYSPALEAAAYGHSVDMGKRHYLNHYTKPFPGDSSDLPHGPSERMEKYGIDFFGTKAENLATIPIGKHTYASWAKDVVSRWMKSRGHRSNILRHADGKESDSLDNTKGNINFLGVACAPRIDKNRKVSYLYATQNFAHMEGKDIDSYRIMGYEPAR